MTSNLWLSFAAVSVTACSLPPDVANSHEHIAVVDRYDREYTWPTPESCNVYLDQRITDQEARLVEYEAEQEGAAMSVVYSLDAAAKHPLRLDVYSGPELTLSAELDPEHLVMRDRYGAVALEVDGYGRSEAETTVRSYAKIDQAAQLALTRCALPLRGELGPIPPFLRNLDLSGRLGEQPDVSQGSSDAPKIVNWDGPVSLLGALLLQAACTRSDGWKCPCLEWQHLVHVEGWCGGS